MSDVISLKELKQWMDSKRDFILIDVRSPSELSHGLLPGAKNIPLKELSDALDLPEKDFLNRFRFEKPAGKTVVFYCRTGNRSLFATGLAKRKGFDVRNFSGSIWEWSAIDPAVKRYGPAPLS
ncbi:MAG: sulfurtransferase [Candidatus Diapherotrites archaeon]|uniref:Sulfurtransferase n=1 Tax=Candidatus Iainarchaeum sp. TaxID=3101447 RepID=A0A8T4LFS2_9ARCH|nr:sulfurtransferase [Candidatus Diapherotrites archaeon]